MNPDKQLPATTNVQRALDEIFGKVDAETKKEALRDVLCLLGWVTSVSLLWIALLRILGRVGDDLDGWLYLVLLTVSVFVAIGAEQLIRVPTHWLCWWSVERREWDAWCDSASARDLTALKAHTKACKEAGADPFAQFALDLKVVDDPVLARGREIESQRLNRLVRRRLLASIATSIFVLSLTFL